MAQWQVAGNGQRDWHKPYSITNQHNCPYFVDLLDILCDNLSAVLIILELMIIESKLFTQSLL